MRSRQKLTALLVFAKFLIFIPSFKYESQFDNDFSYLTINQLLLMTDYRPELNPPIFTNY